VLPTDEELKLAELNAGTTLGMPHVTSQEYEADDHTPLCWQKIIEFPTTT
jgi:hypothetical protein